MMQIRVEEKGITLVCSLAPEIPSGLIGDPGRLQQILINLVGNAVKFTKAGKITVEVGSEAHVGEEVRLRFAVKDTGIGIPRNKQGFLFDSFTQVDSSNTRVFGGTGLGLAICRQLVGLMAGQIGVNSVEGQGSEFWFTVTLGKRLSASPSFSCGESRGREMFVVEQRRRIIAKQEEGIRNSLHLKRDRKDEKILLVEDNLINQQVVHGILTKLGFRLVDVAGNGAEALAVLEKKRYDLILMDIQMPIMDGIMATRTIRATTAWGGADLPIIALTAHALKSDVERCREAGMSDFLTKPVVPEVLAKTLDRWLSPADFRQDRATGQAESEGLGPVYLHSESNTGAVPVFDACVLQEGLAGNSQLISHIISSYLQRLPGQIEAIKAMSSAERDDEVGRLAHALKGSSGSIGAIRLQHLLQELEKAVHNCMPLQQLVQVIEKEGWKLTDVLQQISCPPMV